MQKKSTNSNINVFEHFHQFRLCLRKIHCICHYQSLPESRCFLTVTGRNWSCFAEYIGFWYTMSLMQRNLKLQKHPLKQGSLKIFFFKSLLQCLRWKQEQHCISSAVVMILKYLMQGNVKFEQFNRVIIIVYIS